MTKGVLAVPPTTLTPVGNAPPTCNTSPAIPSVKVTVIVPAPNTPLVKAAVVERSISFTTPVFSSATGSIDTTAPLLEFSVTVGLVTVWVISGGSFTGVTVVPTVLVSDHVLLWSFTLVPRLIPSPKLVGVVSAARIVRLGGVPL